MTIDFYLDNEQKAPTVRFYLFTDYYSEMWNNQHVTHLDQKYQVISQQIAENKGEAHIVFVYPIKNRQNEQVFGGI